MSNALRGASTLWPGTLLATGQAAVSAAGYLGAFSNCALFCKADGAVTFTIQTAMESVPGAGVNLLDSNDVWFDYVRADAYESASGVEGNTAKIVFGGAGAVCIDMSPFAPTYIRLSTADGLNRTVSAFIVVSG